MHEGVDPAFTPDGPRATDLPERYLLFVSTLEPRKNVEGILAGFARAVAQGYPGHLVLVGRWGWRTESIQRSLAASPVRDRILHSSYLDRGALQAALRGAEALLFPSWLEGFGLPALEAMASGAPVILSTTSSLPEVGGDAALYVDPASPESIAAAILRLAGDPALRQALSRAGRERAQTVLLGRGGCHHCPGASTRRRSAPAMGSMNIAFDARPLLGEWTGVGHWLAGLLRELAARTDWHFVLAVPRPAEDLGLPDLADRTTMLAPAVPLPGTLWLHTLAGPALAGHAQVYVGTLGILPRRLPVPSALAVHDLTPISRPRHHTLANRFCFSAYFAESLERADALVCASAATRTRLTAFDRRHGERASVVPLATDRFFSPPPPGEDAAPTRRRFAQGRPFVVQLGTLEPRKGIATLLAAHGRLVASHTGGARPRAGRWAGLGRRVAGAGPRRPPTPRSRAPARLRESRGGPGAAPARRDRGAGLRGGGVRPAPGRGPGVRGAVRDLRRARPAGGRRGLPPASSGAATPPAWRPPSPAPSPATVPACARRASHAPAT